MNSNKDKTMRELLNLAATQGTDGCAGGAVRNAIIERASIDIERGCFLTCSINLDYGGAGQGFGGFVLGGLPGSKAGEHAAQPNYAGEFITKVMHAAGVETFGDLRGKSVRVELSDDTILGRVIGIGHIVKDDRWFRPQEAFDSMAAARTTHDLP